jgi:general secretion pathway protein I
MTRDPGFTLIEVLVALAIVAVGMAAVMRTVSSSADTVFYLRDKTFAQWVALNQIANLRLSGQVPAVGNSDGDIDYAGRKWHWRQEVVASEVPGIERIDMKVRPADLKVADEDSGWYTTASGIFGDAIAAPRGDTPDWGSQLLAPLPGAGSTPNAAVPGTIGSQGAIGSQGSIGSQGTLGSPGGLGAPGTTGPQGTLGAQDTLMPPDPSSSDPGQ